LIITNIQKRIIYFKYILSLISSIINISENKLKIILITKKEKPPYGSLEIIELQENYFLFIIGSESINEQ